VGGGVQSESFNRVAYLALHIQPAYARLDPGAPKKLQLTCEMLPNLKTLSLNAISINAAPSRSRDPATSIQSLKYENRYRVSLQKAGILKRNGSGPRPLVGVIGNLAAEVCLHSFYGPDAFSCCSCRRRSGVAAPLRCAGGDCRRPWTLLRADVWLLGHNSGMGSAQPALFIVSTIGLN
jgi:hypothetical protein